MEVLFRAQCPLVLAGGVGRQGVLVAVVGLVVESFCLGEAGEMEAFKYIYMSIYGYLGLPWRLRQ